MMKKMHRRLVVLALSAAAALAAGSGWADAFPAKPVTLVVAYPAGGDTDALARVFAEKLSSRIGQPVLVENRPGASGIIGSSYVAKAQPDGYTLLLAPSTFSIAQLVLKSHGSASYDVLNGFTPIIETGTLPLFLAAGPGTGIKGFQDAMAAAKARPLTYASPGSGSPMHILGEMVNKAAAVHIGHVPYRGVAPAIIDVLGGHVPLTYVTYGPVAPYLGDGKLALLAVADSRRSPLAPQVPTLQELGYKDIEVSAWHGLFGPRGLPAETVKSLNGHFNEILRMPDVVARMAALGVLPLGGAPETLARTNAADFERFGRIVKELGIQAD